MSALNDDQLFDHYLKTCGDKECWEAFSSRLRQCGIEWPIDQIQGTPLPLLMANIQKGFADGSLDASPRWLPFIERAFRYIQSQVSRN